MRFLHLSWVVPFYRAGCLELWFRYFRSPRCPHLQGVAAGSDAQGCWRRSAGPPGTLLSSGISPVPRGGSQLLFPWFGWAFLSWLLTEQHKEIAQPRGAACSSPRSPLPWTLGPARAQGVKTRNNILGGSFAAIVKELPSPHLFQTSAF